MIAKVPYTDDTFAVSQKESAISALREKTLKASGWALIAGDVSLAIAKKMEKNPSGLGGVALWLAGGAVAGFFGNPSAEKKLQLMEHRLGAHLRKQGIAIPENPTLAELAKDGGVISQIESFLYSYPAELLNTAFAVGGALVVKGGFDKKSTPNKISGALVTAGALCGLLIPEKKPDPAHPAEGIVGKTREWIQEKPLRLASAFYMANDIPVFLEAEKQRKAGSKSYIARYVTVASYVFGNTMLWLSSKENLSAKDHLKNTKMLDDLAGASAQVIVAQPQPTQEALVQQVASYLSAQPEIKKTAPEIAEILHAKLTETKKTMQAAGTWQQQIQSQPSASPSL